MNWIETIKRLYQRGKRALVYIDLVFVVIVLYAGKYLGGLRDQLLPAAIAGAFAILLEILFSISDTISSKQEMTEYPNINMAFPKILDLIKQRSQRKHSVKIIASAGGTTVNSIVPQLIHETTEALEISISLINPKMRANDYLPKHWGLESRATLNHLEKIGLEEISRVRIVCNTYDYVPCIRGFLVDNQHLFLGYFYWVKSGGTIELKGAEHPHIYYQRSSKYEHLFRLFESWFDNAPHTQVIPARKVKNDKFPSKN